MEKINAYIDRFLLKVNLNDRYDMNAMELIVLSNEAEKDSMKAVSTTFQYGYIKGYRAALAEMKKRGVVSCK